MSNAPNQALSQSGCIFVNSSLELVEGDSGAINFPDDLFGRVYPFVGGGICMWISVVGHIPFVHPSSSSQARANAEITEAANALTEAGNGKGLALMALTELDIF